MKEKEDAKASPFTVNTEGSDRGTGRKTERRYSSRMGVQLL